MATEFDINEVIEGDVASEKLPDVRKLVGVLAPAVAGGDALDMRFWLEGDEQKPRFRIVHRRTVDARAFADKLTAREAFDLVKVRP